MCDTLATNAVRSGWMRPADVAADLGVSRATVIRWAKNGEIPATRIGRSWLINRALLDEQMLAGLAT